jgi:hypothetical protein
VVGTRTGLAAYLPITDHVAASPSLMLCVPVSVVLLTWGRRCVPAIGAVGLTVAMFAVEIPLYLVVCLVIG